MSQFESRDLVEDDEHDSNTSVEISHTGAVKSDFCFIVHCQIWKSLRTLWTATHSDLTIRKPDWPDQT